jgi:hypothetical protein
MARILSDFLDVSGEALRFLDNDDPADEWLLMRRAAEYQFGGGPGGISDQDFLQAAGILRGLGQVDEAIGLESLAATTNDLANADLDWAHRYDARQATVRELEDMDLAARGRIRRDGNAEPVTGIDGALYAGARVVTAPGGRAAPGDTVPAVLVVSHARTVEIVTGFHDERETMEWLADRQQGRAAPTDGFPGPPEPLTGCATGPDCRTRLEEQVLAGLLRAGDPARCPAGVHGGHDGSSHPPSHLGITQGLTASAFSAHSRSEIFLAWQAAAASVEGASATGVPALGEVRYELARRLLRTPDWAALAVGWPFGQIALRYFDRLAVTSVTREQAEVAARRLCREDLSARRVGPYAAQAQLSTLAQRTRGQAQHLRPPESGGPSGSAPKW